jgi:hypothetical protein
VYPFKDTKIFLLLPEKERGFYDREAQHKKRRYKTYLLVVNEKRCNSF